MRAEKNREGEQALGVAAPSTLAASTVAAAFEVDAAGLFIHVNQKVVELLGARSAADLVGRSLAELLTEPADAKLLRRARRKGGLRDVVLRLKGRHGRRVLRGDFSQAGNPEYLQGLFIDVTEVHLLRSSMQRSARLEALGSLTSGVAHDLNNLLTVLIGNLALAAESLRGRPEEFAKIKSARDAATRGADLIQQLLAFARQQSIEAEVIDPAKIVANLVPLVGRALGARVALDAKLEEQAGMIQGNAAQLESVIVNLAVNARDAMDSGGKVTIGVSERRLGEKEALSRRLSGAGVYVCIEVSDNGSGIPEETLARVFEPFFSTKGELGSGLGLAMVRNYADQFTGVASIDSVVGQGTTVNLWFPRCEETTNETTVKTMPLSTLPTGRESVLVVAAEEHLRSTVSQILSVLGYAVRNATEPDEAVRLARETRIDLLILDAPNAPKLLSALVNAAKRAGQPMCRAIQLRSSADIDGTHEAPHLRFLSKPFSLADLAKTVRTTLDAPSPPEIEAQRSAR